MPRKGQNIYKRRDGRWEGRFIRCHDENGKAKYGYVYAKTYSEAKQRLIFAQSNIGTQSKNIVSGVSGISYGEVLDKWLESTKLSVKESTYVQYRKLVDDHIRPYLGNVRVQDMNTFIIESHLFFLLNNGRKDQCGGLSPKTVNDIFSIVKDTLNYSKSLGYTITCDLGQVTIRNKSHSMRVLSIDEQRKLMKVLCTDIDRYKFGVILSLYTGLRIGELCALKWQNVDLENATLTIIETMQRIQSDNKEGSKTKIVITSPKSEKSKRDIPIPPFVVEMAKLLFTAPEDFVLSARSDSLIEPRVMQYRFKKYVTEAGIPDANFHALRHTFATRCIECGFETKSLSEILGHSSITITLNRYVHSSMELKRQNMDKLNSVCVI